jgi:hypothetical protein
VQPKPQVNADSRVLEPDRSWREQRDAAGELVGWWYAESDVAHVDAWIGHGFPHVLVLHRLGGRSYWVHVRKDRVERTGRGVKICVPADQQINPASRDALIEVAATQRLRSSYDGSAWGAGAPAAAPGAVLRYALLAPRLIAPHRNTGFGRAVTAEEALALVVRARASDLDAFREQHTEVPRVADCLAHRDWRWRFVGAVETALVEGDRAHLDAVYRSGTCRTGAPPRPRSVVRCCSVPRTTRVSSPCSTRCPTTAVRLTTPGCSPTGHGRWGRGAGSRRQRPPLHRRCAV